MEKEYTEIGIILKPHGLKGDVVLKVEPTVEAILADFKSVFLNQNGFFCSLFSRGCCATKQRQG